MKQYISALTFASMLCASVFGYTNVYWAGGESGDWNDPNNWSPKEAPVDKSYCAIITPRTAPATITITNDISVGQVLFGVTGEKPPDGDHFPMITLTGPGSITASNASYVYDFRQCEFAGGLKYSLTTFWLTGTNLVFCVNDGATVTTEYIQLGRNSALGMDGGTLNVERFSAESTSSVGITNGNLNVSIVITLPEATKFSWEGGCISINFNINDPRFVPDREDETLVMPSASTQIKMPSGDGTAYYMPGKIFQTNTTHAGGAFTTEAYSYWWGGGEIYSDYFKFPYQARTELALSKLCVGRQLFSNISDTSSRIDIYGGIEFGAMGNWSSAPSSRIASLYLRGPIKANTRDCFDGETLRTIDLQNLYPRPSSVFEATGGGVVTACVRSAVCPFDAVVVTNGTRLVVRRISGSQQVFLTRKLSVLDDSVLELTAGTHPMEVHETPYISPSATVLVNLPASTTAGKRYPILSTCRTNAIDISRFSLTAADSGNWRIAESFGRVYLTDDVVVTPVFDYEWTGAVNGNWSEPGNWNCGEVPNATTATAVFRSGNQVAVTNDIEGLKVYSLRFEDGGPFTILGNKITISSENLNSATNDAIYARGTVPATIVAPIKGPGWWFGIKIDSDSFLTLLGDVSGGLGVVGDLRLGGKVDIGVYYTFGQRNNSRSAMCNLLPGSVMTISSQSQDNLGGRLDIPKDAKVSYNGGRFRCNGSRTHFVDGTLEILPAAKYSGVADQNYIGTGLLAIGKPLSYASANSTTLLGQGITLRPPARWNTFTSESAANYVRLGVESWGTISITNDFAYGPTPNLETTTTAADRALQLPRPSCTLTINTQDPLTGEGHTATFEDPIIGYGKLVKRGAGTLVFASSENAITGGVEIVEGTFTWTAPQTLQKLSFGSGAKIVFPAAAPRLTVENSLDLTGAEIDISGISPTAFYGWTELVATSAGGSITGFSGLSSDRFYSRVVSDGSGGMALEVRSKIGSQFILR